MAPIFLYNGGILLRNGMIATHQDCCCSSSTSELFAEEPLPEQDPEPQPP